MIDFDEIAEEFGLREDLSELETKEVELKVLSYLISENLKETDEIGQKLKILNDRLIQIKLNLKTRDKKRKRLIKEIKKMRKQEKRINKAGRLADIPA